MKRPSPLKHRWLVLLAASLSACGPAETGREERTIPAVVGEPLDLATPAAPGSGEPRLFVAGDEILMSWLQPAGDAHELRFSRLREGEWSSPATVVRRLDLFVNWADFPSVIELPDGRLAAHWLQYSGPGAYSYDVWVATSKDGGATWSEPGRPHSDGTPTEHGFVSLFAAPGSDSLSAVWLDGRAYADTTGLQPFMSLRAASLSANGSWTEGQVLDDRTCDCCQTSAAPTSDGVIVAYRGRTEGEIRDIRVVRYAAGRWSHPVTVHDDGWEIPACPVNGPSISARGDTVALAWFTAADDVPRVWVAFSRDGGRTFQEPLLVDGERPLGRVSVSAIEGGALVAWLAAIDSGAEVMVRALGPNGRGTTALLLGESSAERASGFPVMVARDRKLVAAWTVPGDPGTIRVVTAPFEVPAPGDR